MFCGGDGGIDDDCNGEVVLVTWSGHVFWPSNVPAPLRGNIIVKYYESSDPTYYFKSIKGKNLYWWFSVRTLSQMESGQVIR